MRRSLTLLPFALIAVAGCAEMQNGPRVVTLSNDRFDIRYAPPIDTRSDINALAATVCEQWGGRQPLLLGSAQYLAADLRVSTYKCVSPSAASSAASLASAPPAHSG